MTDIVERLEAQGMDAFAEHYSLGMHGLCAEAAAKIKVLREAYQSMSAAIGMAKMLIDQGDAAGARRRLDEASEAILALGADDIARTSPSTQETKP